MCYNVNKMCDNESTKSERKAFRIRYYYKVSTHEEMQYLKVNSDFLFTKLFI